MSALTVAIAEAVVWADRGVCPGCGSTVITRAGLDGSARLTDPVMSCPSCQHPVRELHVDAPGVGCTSAGCLCLTPAAVAVQDVAAMAAEAPEVAAAVAAVTPQTAERMSRPRALRVPVLRPRWVLVRLPLVVVSGRVLPPLVQPAVLAVLVLSAVLVTQVAGWVL